MIDYNRIRDAHFEDVEIYQSIWDEALELFFLREGELHQPELSEDEILKRLPHVNSLCRRLSNFGAQLYKARQACANLARKGETPLLVERSKEFSRSLGQHKRDYSEAFPEKSRW